MDLIYNVVWSTTKPLKSNLCGKVVVAWSCRNLVAFSTGYRKLDNLDGQSSSSINDENSSFSSGHKELIQSLTWDGTGSRLLSSDLVGICKLWAMKDHMINDWECISTVDVGEGERLVAISWIDTGIKNLFTLTPDDAQLSVIPKNLRERYKTNKSKPPLVEIGGMRAKDGWVAISETGLVCVTTLKPEVRITRKCLAQVRARVAVADLAFTTMGKVIAVANDGEIRSAVQFYRVSLPGGPDGCQILSDPLPCLFAHSHTEQDFSEYYVSNLQFVSKNSGEAILVCTTGKNGSCIKRWEMKKGKIQVHERFQQEIASHLHPYLPNYSVYEWTIINVYKDPANIVSLCISPKRVRYSADNYGPGCFGAICFSPCCCCAVGVTMTGDLCMFKLQHLSDTLDAVLRLFIDDFSLQDISQQLIYGSRFRTIKASLLKCTKDGAGQAVDCFVHQLLIAIAATFRSLLRHNATDQLAKIPATVDVDVDKVLQALDTKELTLESTTVLSLFPIIQWLADVAMFVVNVVAFTSYHNKESAPGVSLMRDTNFLATLREMLVLIRLWGQTTPGVLPSITPSADKNESLALLFKILTKIWLLSRQANTDEPDVAALEDRLAAEAAPLTPNFSSFLQNIQVPSLNRGVSGKAVSTGQIKPSQYQFGTQPVLQRTHPIFHPSSSAIFPMPADGIHTVDVVRRVFLDKSPYSKLKQCTRCNCVSLIDSIGDHIAAKAWEQRWVRSCVCGGSWRRLPFKEQEQQQQQQQSGTAVGSE
ncbi:Mediator of RNA polymerase II transcription subunit 16 [Acropora cervicornis]|uniref:Mediator of RNA polymerase II transcription subunit 16 n=1 Tax=Acropora cervicornis TaxID=6130 RepID=A0AAD9R6J9_ACRCE|nr:Mediator of RNA polymerase II transcription subunit 16 [Acropora cervicornis]